LTGFHALTEPVVAVVVFLTTSQYVDLFYVKLEEVPPVLRETGWYSMGDMTNTSEAIWLSRKDLADRLGVPNKTPAEWATKGTGPKYARFGRHVRYRLSDVIAWEDERLTEGGR
jgi:excisionase family DNA binding protein